MIDAATRPLVWRRLGTHLLVAGTYLALALIYLRPFGVHLRHTLPRAEQNDVLLHGWILNWTARQVLRAPWQLFDANVFFPHRGALAYTEHLLPEALPVAPLLALTGDPVLTYNVAYLLTFVIGGWGMFVLARRLTGDPLAAWVAGAFVCYFPAKRWNLAHINTIAVHGVPLALLALHRLLETPRWRRAVGAGALIAFASLASAYYTVYLPLLLLPGVPLLWWADRRDLDGRRATAVLLAAATAAGLAVAVLWPYTGVWSPDTGHPWALQVAGAADVGEFLILDSLLWHRLLLPQVLDPLTTPFFPGVTVTVLLALALLARRRRPAAAGLPAPTRGRRMGRALGHLLVVLALVVALLHLVGHHRAVVASSEPPVFPVAAATVPLLAGLGLLLGLERRRFPVALREGFGQLSATPRPLLAYMLLAGLAFLLALGPRLKFFGYEGPPLPYELVYRWVPPASSLRAPFRAGLLGMVFLAVPLAYGAGRLIAAARARRGQAAALGAAVALVAALVVEFTGRALPLDDLPRPESRVYEWIAEQEGEFGILDWPIPDSLDASAPAQWLSTGDWKGRVTGHNGRVPEDVQHLFDLSFRPLDDEFFLFLVEWFPVRYVIVHLHAFPPEVQEWMDGEGIAVLERWWEPVRRFGPDIVYRPRNGGPAGELRRRLPRRMLRGELVLQLGAPRPPDAAPARLAVLLDASRVAEVEVPPGARRIVVALPAPPSGAGDLSWLRIVGPAGGGALVIDSVRVRTPEGVVYP